MQFDEQIRVLTILALFSDDQLFDRIVLKGGNAMSIVHRISQRVSQDLDFSLSEEFEDLPAVCARMQRELERSFQSIGHAVFDVKLTPKPARPGVDAQSWWGGYALEFKLMPVAKHTLLVRTPERLRREASVVGLNQQKIFKVDFSKYEYTDPKEKAELDQQTIYVYPPGLIAVEKLRAICQQMDAYAPTAVTHRPRARDFYDIHAIVVNTGFCFDSAEARALLPHVFDAKQVPLALIGRISETRAFHANDWASVRVTHGSEIESFDFYFDFVLDAVAGLADFWEKS